MNFAKKKALGGVVAKKVQHQLSTFKKIWVTFQFSSFMGPTMI